MTLKKEKRKKRNEVIPTENMIAEIAMRSPFYDRGIVRNPVYDYIQKRSNTETNNE